MRERWNRWRSGLSHQTKMLGNLALALVLVFWVWACKGYPLPTAEMDFRRLERQNLLKPSEIVLNMPDGLGGDEVVGVGEEYVFAAETDGGGWYNFYLYEQNPEGVTPVFTAGSYSWFFEEEMRLRAIRGAVVPDMPEDAAESTLAIWENGEWHRFDGERQELGAWLFPVYGLGSTHFSSALPGYTYELTAYDGQGNLLVQQKGQFP